MNNVINGFKLTNLNFAYITKEELKLKIMFEIDGEKQSVIINLPYFKM